ncbi:hypothetical protein DU002_04745 [Corallincola holothuriorum]|uniref:Uncharacterized protein n=1 Tax=Corallincola holothuriorum TaxID=2282215 RepID=A0A368NNU7_9GAMM|nr:hypothetical protein DU002_04745 [Corallincola holothuriorum]
MLLFVIAKIGWEQMLGPLQSSNDMMPEQIAIQAHLYGAIFGVALGVISRNLFPLSNTKN